MTLLAEAMVLLTFFWFYRLLADRFDAEAVGIYSLARRVLALLIPLVMMGLAETLGRYVATARSATEKSRLLSAAALIMFVPLAAVFIGVNALPQASAKLIFGSAALSGLIFPFSMLLLGLCIHTFTYSFLRGNLQIRALNLLQMVGLGLLPVLVLLPKALADLSAVFIWIGALQSVNALLFLAAAALGGKLPAQGINRSTVGNLLRFGAARLPAPLASAGLLSLGPLVAAHYISLTEVGYLSLSMALLVGLGGGLSPLGSVLLPHVSGLAGKGELARFGDKVHILVGALLQILLFLQFQFIVFADYILRIWMGPGFVAAAPAMQIVFLALVAYGFFVVMRNILDAVVMQPLNSVNSTAALICLAVSLGILTGLKPPHLLECFALAFTAAFCLLGGLTYRAIGKVFPGNGASDWQHLKWGVLLNILLAAAAWGAKTTVTAHLAGWLGFELFLVLIYVVMLHKLKVDWIGKLWTGLFPKAATGNS